MVGSENVIEGGLERERRSVRRVTALLIERVVSGQCMTTNRSDSSGIPSESQRLRKKGQQWVNAIFNKMHIWQSIPWYYSAFVGKYADCD